jgi:glycosyltransferase involved in cell wall biosynthesis
MTHELERTTLIIPTFNRSGYLLETLESVFAQTLQPAEIIVADDGSTDDTPDVMARLGDRITYVRKENSGKADTLDAMIRRAKHDLIWIVDDDDLVLPHALETLTGLMNGHPEIGFAYGAYEAFHVDTNTGAHVRRHPGYWPKVADDQFFRANLEDFFTHHPGLLVRKAAYQAVGPFSRLYGRSEDYEMMIRLADRYRSRHTDDTVFLQRQHDGLRFGGLAGDQRMQRWSYENTEMFREVRNRFPLSHYLPHGQRDEPLSPALHREALIVRGGLMARKKLWAEALEDYSAATALGGPAKLNPPEARAVWFAQFSKYGNEEILSDPAIKAGLQKLAKASPLGRTIVRTIARSLAYFVRTRLQSGAYAKAAAYAALATRLALT